MKFRGVLTFSMIVLGAGFLSGSGGQTSNGLGGNVLEALPRDLEMQWALSAIPVYLRSDATVYTLDPAKGYVVAKQGGNGFNCFVERTDYVREDYRNDLIYPLCFDPEGSKTIMPVSFDVARIRAEGKVSPAALHQEIMRKFKDGIYRSPARPGISYMLSPVTRLYGGPGSNETRLMNLPHYMFYAPNLTSKDFGGGPPLGPYPYLINAGPHAYMIVNVGEAEKLRFIASQRISSRIFVLTGPTSVSKQPPRRARSTEAMCSVKVRLTESLSTVDHGQPVMRHGRFFTNASSDQILSLLLGLKFYGPGGLMADSTGDSEEDSPDGSSRFIKRFRPLGTQFGLALAGCFDVHQELVECTMGPKGIAATIKMTFSPSNEKDREPCGSFLWLVEPVEHERERGALWTELINSPETVSRHIPGLRIGRGKKLIFRLGHNRLIRKAAQRIAEVLNTGDSPDVQFADYAAGHRLSFKPRMCE